MRPHIHIFSYNVYSAHHISIMYSRHYYYIHFSFALKSRCGRSHSFLTPVAIPKHTLCVRAALGTLSLRRNQNHRWIRHPFAPSNVTNCPMRLVHNDGWSKHYERANLINIHTWQFECYVWIRADCRWKMENGFGLRVDSTISIVFVVDFHVSHIPTMRPETININSWTYCWINI